MTPAEQLHRWDAMAVAHQNGSVVIRVGREDVELPPKEARRFAYELAGAILRAEGVVITPSMVPA